MAQNIQNFFNLFNQFSLRMIGEQKIAIKNFLKIKLCNLGKKKKKQLPSHSSHKKIFSNQGWGRMSFQNWLATKNFPLQYWYAKSQSWLTREKNSWSAFMNVKIHFTSSNLISIFYGIIVDRHIFVYVEKRCGGILDKRINEYRQRKLY